jgi:hypothetical protein
MPISFSGHSLESIAMHTYETDAGTPVVEMTEAEYHDFLDREVRKGVGMSLEDFQSKLEAGEIDWDDPEAFELAGLVGAGQNGHR